jgi:TetR/AcrR family transcriptional regulator, regulator of biofilm formation and stress response
MAPPMAERGLSTRRRLLQATAELIPELGWGAVTTRKVAARAGVRPGVVHYHFSAVSELLAEAAMQFCRDALAAPMATLHAAPDVPTGLDALLAAVHAIGADDDTALLMTESALAATRDEHLRTQMRAVLAGFRAEVATWLRRHGNDTDADATAAVVTATLDGLLLHRAIDPALPVDAVGGPLRRLAGTTPVTRGEEIR